jgi:hypothetical protein
MLDLGAISFHSLSIVQVSWLDFPFIILYNAFVRTHLDYVSSVWAPFKAKHIEQIEGVQRRATKQIPGFRDMTYSERLRALKLPSLSYRKLRGDMIEVVEMCSNKCVV